MGRSGYDTTGTEKPLSLDNGLSQIDTSQGTPTQVLVVSGKKANKAFRTALSLHQEATNDPPKDSGNHLNKET